MFPLGQIVLGVAQHVKLLLSLNILLGVALLGAVVHSSPEHMGQQAHVETGSAFMLQSGYSVLTDSLEDGPRKQAYQIRPIIPPLFYKFHFVFALLMFFFVALMVLAPTMTERALLLLPVVLSYGASHILFACDQAEMLEGMMERYKRRISKPLGYGAESGAADG
jgi:hypothetical protein